VIRLVKFLCKDARSKRGEKADQRHGAEACHRRRKEPGANSARYADPRA
jgi:hypothetical protein